MPANHETITITHTTSPVAPAREIKVPARMGSVRLIREIGRGGMGVVWLGRDEFLGRDVAVKFLLGAVASEGDPLFSAFFEGARAAAALKCPGLTAIYSAGVVEDAPYIVMEYARGQTLSRIVSKGGPLRCDLAASALLDILATVTELHDAGVIHRDLKPSNVIVDTEGTIFLTDFGISVERPLELVGNIHVMVAGSPVYMAPEMFRGEVSSRSDVYALGMAAWEMLTGHAAFSGTIGELQTAHERTPLPFAELRALGVPEPFVEVIDRATRKDTKFRYRTARAMKQAADGLFVNEAARQKAREQLRAHCRALGEGGVADAAAGAPAAGTPPPTPAPTPVGTLYDHLSNLAAKKRGETPQIEGKPVGVSTPIVAPPSADANRPPPRQGLFESVATPPASAPRPASSNQPRLAVSLACSKCGHDLRSTPMDGVCPECAAPMSLSLRRERMVFAPESWLRGVRRGMWACYGAIGLVIVAGLIEKLIEASVAPGFQRAEDVSLSDVVVGSIFLLALASVLAGGWWITVARPADRRPGVRLAARAGIVLILVASLFSILAAILVPNRALGYSTIGVLTSLGACVVLMRHLQTLADDAEDRALRRWAWAAIGLCAATLVAGLPQFATLFPGTFIEAMVRSPGSSGPSVALQSSFVALFAVALIVILATVSRLGWVVKRALRVRVDRDALTTPAAPLT